jgi:hypothetical protein
MELNQEIRNSIQLVAFLFVSIISNAQQKGKADYSDFRTGKFTLVIVIFSGRIEAFRGDIGAVHR